LRGWSKDILKLFYCGFLTLYNPRITFYDWPVRYAIICFGIY